MNADSLHDWAMLGVIVLGAIFVLATSIFLWQAQRSKTSPIDMANVFQDEKGKTSGPRIAYFLGALTGIWIAVYLTIDGKMNAEIIGIILGILMLGKVGSQYLDSRSQPQSSMSEETTSKRTVVQTDDAKPERAPDPRKQKSSI